MHVCMYVRITLGVYIYIYAYKNLYPCVYVNWNIQKRRFKGLFVMHVCTTLVEGHQPLVCECPWFGGTPGSPAAVIGPLV